MNRTRPSNPKVVLDVEAAEEVAELITDTPGTADEDLLDDALVAIRDAGPRIAPDDQLSAARGEVVAMEITPNAADAVTELIVDDVRKKPMLLRRIGDRLRAKLDRARSRRR